MADDQGELRPPLPKTPIIDNETAALFKVGFIKPTDGVIFAVVMLILFVSTCYAIFAQPDPLKLICLILFVQFILLFWIVILTYRVSYFVLKLSGIVHTMPEQAARLAVSFHAQQATAQAATDQKSAEPTRPL
jgi:hypothetical protein